MAGNHRQNVFLTANLFGDTAQNMDGQSFSPRFVPLSVQQSASRKFVGMQRGNDSRKRLSNPARNTAASFMFLSLTVLMIIQLVCRNTGNALALRSGLPPVRGAESRSSLVRGAGVAGEPRGRKSAGKAGIGPSSGSCRVFFGRARRSARRKPYAAIESVA